MFQLVALKVQAVNGDALADAGESAGGGRPGAAGLCFTFLWAGKSFARVHRSGSLGKRRKKKKDGNVRRSAEGGPMEGGSAEREEVEERKRVVQLRG